MQFRMVPPPTFIDTTDKMVRLCDEIKDKKIFAFDTETTGLELMTANLLFFSICTDLNNRYFIERKYLNILKKEIAFRKDITWVMHNSNFDRCMLANTGFSHIEGPVHCTKVLHWVYDDTLRHGLKEISTSLLGLHMREFKEVFPLKRGENYGDSLLRVFNNDPESVIDYASLDAWATFAVYQELRSILEETPAALDGLTLFDIFTKIEVPFADILFRMTRRGVRVNAENLEKKGKLIEIKLDELQRKINKECGKVINIRSDDQIRDILFGKMKLKPLKLTKGGSTGNKKNSVDKETIQYFAAQNIPIATYIHEFNTLDTVLNNYCKGLVKHIHTDGRIHPNYNQDIKTGRISSTNPSLLNIKRPDEDDYQIRAEFIPEDGNHFVDADYSQLEMCVIAHLANEENIINNVKAGKDIHAGNTELVFGIPYDDISWAKEEEKNYKKEKIAKEHWDEYVVYVNLKRQHTKGVGFGLNYGQGIRKLALKLGVSTEEARQLTEDYFRPLPAIKQFIEDSHAFARENLCVPILLGRIRPLKEANFDWKPGFFSHRSQEWVPERPGRVSSGAMRQAVNGQVQGGAADIAKISQIAIERSKPLDNLGYEQILQIHDEILGECPKNHAKEAMSLVERIMGDPFPFAEQLLGIKLPKFRCPLRAEAGSGANWAEAH